MQKDDTVRLRHMLDAARQAVDFTRDKSRAELDSDPMLVLALVKLVEIIGETASQVTDLGRANAPNLPWAEIVGMRHVSFTRTLILPLTSFGKRYDMTCLP